MRVLWTFAVVSAACVLVVAALNAARHGDRPATALFAAGVAVLALLDGVGVLIDEKVRSRH